VLFHHSDDLNMRLNTIAQRLTLSLQLIPIQKAKTTHKRLVGVRLWLGCCSQPLGLD